MQETSFITSPTSGPLHLVTPDIGDSETPQNSQKQSISSKYFGWIVSNPKKTLAFLTLGLTGVGVGSYFLARELGAPPAESLANRNATLMPDNNMLLLGRAATTRLLPSLTLSPKTIEFIEKSITELPPSVTTLPSTVPDWYKNAATSEALTPSGNVLPTMNSNGGKSHSELPTSATISPSAVTDTHQKATASTISKSISDRKIVERPYAEYEKPGYLIFSDADFRGVNRYESMDIKKEIVRQLPKDVDLVVYTSGDANTTRNTFKSLIHDERRLHILKVENPRVTRFWARDGVPVPVYGKDGSLILIDAKYYHGFESDQLFANFFNATLKSHNHYFEGGNFLADSNANCFIVDKRKNKKQKMSDDVFKEYYGCKKVTRLKKRTGIGHVDEVIKIIDSRNIITDQLAYRPILKRLGYNVTMIPKAKNKRANYLNSLIIDSKVFVPVFGTKNRKLTNRDKNAIKIYQSFGLEVHPLFSRKVSIKRYGSIHCMTMTYPKINNIKLNTPGVS